MKVLYITRFTYAQGNTFYCSEIYNYLFYKFLLVGFILFLLRFNKCSSPSSPPSFRIICKISDEEKQLLAI